MRIDQRDARGPVHHSLRVNALFSLSTSQLYNTLPLANAFHSWTLLQHPETLTLNQSLVLYWYSVNIHWISEALWFKSRAKIILFPQVIPTNCRYFLEGKEHSRVTIDTGDITSLSPVNYVAIYRHKVYSNRTSEFVIAGLIYRKESQVNR